jgi:hypothetical protein
MTNETQKLIDILHALHTYAPAEFKWPEVLETALELLGRTSDKRRGNGKARAPRKPRDKAPEAAA